MTYKNSTELMQLNGVPIYMNDLAEACLRGRLNLFLQGDTGSGKTQLAQDVRSYYFGSGVGSGNLAKKVKEKFSDRLDPKAIEAIEATKYFPEDKTLFILGRNDMDTRELFQQINIGKLHQTPKYNLEPLVNPDTGELEYYYPKVNKNGVFVYQKLNEEQADRVKKELERIAGSTEHIKELTSKINTNLIVVDELPNCVPAVRAQLFNLFDGFVELNGKAYPIGNGYSVGIATGNIGQKFTESSNELGRALKDRMHVIVDTDYFTPKPSDTLEILANNTNPRVEFAQQTKATKDLIEEHKKLASREIHLEKLILANYLVHGLDYCSKGSKRKMKDAWPTQLESHEQGSDVGLILPVSTRAAKSIIRLSEALDDIVSEKQPDQSSKDYFDSMMQAFKFVSAYSGILNPSSVQANYNNDFYKALDAVISTTKTQYDEQKGAIAVGIEMAYEGKRESKILNKFTGRWEFMRDILNSISEKSKK